MFSGIRAILLSGSATIAMAVPAAADSFLWANPGSGDFFLTGNWQVFSGFPPVEAYPGELQQGSMAIANGGTVNLDLTDPRVPGLFFLNNIQVGAGDQQTNTGIDVLDTAGTFLIDGGAGGGTFDRGGFSIGVASGVDTSANGTVRTTNANISSTIQPLSVGFNQSTDTSSVATGVLDVDGSLDVANMTVGGTNGASGTASGTVTTKSLASSFAIQIGSTNLTSTTPPVSTDAATGSVTVTDGDAKTQNLTVGSALQFGTTVRGDLGAAAGDLVFTNESATFGNLIRIGTATPFTLAPPSGIAEATGTVTARAAYSELAPGARPITGLSVGLARGSGVASGSLIAPEVRAGKTLDFGGETFDQGVSVGVARDGGTATGVLNIGSVFTATEPASTGFNANVAISVGRITNGNGADPTMVDGTAEIGGLSKFGSVFVGNVDTDAGPGSATGRLTIGAGGFEAGRRAGTMRIGVTQGEANADGAVTLNGDYVSDGPFGGILVGSAGNTFGISPLTISGTLVPIGDAKGALTVNNSAIRAQPTTSTFGTRTFMTVGKAAIGGTEVSRAEGTVLFDASGGAAKELDLLSLNVGESATSDTSKAEVLARFTARNANATIDTMNIGTTFTTDDSTANMDAEVAFEDSVIASRFVSVGRVGFRGDVDARLALRSSRMTAETMRVGTFQRPVGGARSVLELDASLLEVTSSYSMVQSATAIFHIDDTVRGTGYGAMDLLGTASLDGTARIAFGPGFDFAGAVGSVFDLIVANAFTRTSGPDPMIASFRQVVFDGLPPEYFATTFFTEEGGKEIFRLALERVGEVPLPATLWMVLAALAPLRLFRRRGA